MEMDQWLEISINADGDPDALCEKLSEYGLSGFVTEDEKDFRNFLKENEQYWDYVDKDLETQFSGTSRVKFWLEDSEESKNLLTRLEKDGYPYSCNLVRSSDWENAWRDYYHPIEIGKQLVIVPEWEEAPAGRLAVKLDPGLLFGTGSHATTRMCLQAAENFKGRRVLDLGCGSGILGIAAAVLGSEEIVSVDIDEKAPEIVHANAALNNCSERFQVHVGDICGSEKLRRKLGDGYDVVFANIVSDVIIALAPYVPLFMKPGGVFITSGIIDGREEEVESALIKAGFKILEHKHEEEWHCFICHIDL